MHTDFACLLYSMINNKLEQEELEGMVKEAVKFVADRLCYTLVILKFTTQKILLLG